MLDFSTIWVPLVSVKAIRPGPWRIHRCPVHDRIELAAIVHGDELTAAVCRARRTTDSGIW